MTRYLFRFVCAGFLLGLVTILNQPLFAQAGINEPAMMSLAGDSTTRFHSMFQLSDGTFLVGGEANTLNWLSGSIPVTTLTVPGTTNSSSPRVAFILHMTEDMKTIVRAVRFPANTVQNVFRIKTNAIPGQTTGDLFISGARQNEASGTGLFPGYYLAKLNGNFLNGNAPTGLSFLYDVNCRNIASNNVLGLELMQNINQYKAIQPWDVQSDGKIVFGQGHAYSASWASVNRLTQDGRRLDTVPFWPNHNVRIRSNVPLINRLNTETSTNDGITVIDSIRYTNNNLGFTGNVAVDSVYSSTLVFKVNRSGSNLRSYKQADFDLTQTDENGNPGRAGKYPEDFMYSSACISGACPNQGTNPVTLYETNFGNNDNATHRTGGIVIDRRNNDLYIGYSTLCKHPRSRFQSSDTEPIVLAMNSRGETKWWNRLHKEEPANGSPAAQEVDGLAIDYNSNQLVVAGASLDTCKNNFWKGNEVALNGDGNGFQNQFTGTNNYIRFSWLGKMNLSNGQLRAASYVADYNNDIGAAGAPFEDPMMNGWPNPNNGNPNLDNTKINGLEVAPNGDVLIRGEATRTITTANAYMRMPKPGQGLSPKNQFVRVYSPDLDSVKFSSSVALVYEPNVSTTTSSIVLQAAAFSPQGIVVAGFANNNFGKLASVGTPSFGDSLSSRKRGFIGRFARQCDTVATPTAINGGPAIVCEGGTYTFTTPNPDNQLFVWSYPRGWRGSDSAYTANTASITLRATSAAEAGKISVVRKSNCAVSIPFGSNLARPLPTRISINLNPTSTAATYSLPTNSAVWFVGNDTARRANGQPIRTSTLVLSQIVPALVLPATITARVTNDCGSFVSNSVVITGLKSLLNPELLTIQPNPAQNRVMVSVPEDYMVENMVITDLVGKSQTVSFKKGEGTSSELNISQLPAGVYNLRVNCRQGVFQKRMVKE